MRKVLHVGEIVKGGVATYISTLLEINDEVENYIILSKDGSNKKWNLDRTHIFYYNYRRSLIGIIKGIKSIIHCIKKVNPDVIYCHSTWAGAMVRIPLFFWYRKYLVIYNAHGWSFLRDTSRFKKLIYGIFELILSWRTDCIINVSQNEYISALKYFINESKMKIIYSGVKYNPGLGEPIVSWDQRKINILFVGRFDRPKGVDYLLKEFKKVRRTDVHLYLVGANVLLDGEVIEENNTDAITFLGWKEQNELNNYYKACDVVIVPSRWEAFGLVAVEAMMNSKPVIVSNNGALPELVDDGCDGFIFDMNEQDSLQQLIEKLNKTQLIDMGNNALKKYNNKYKDELMKKNTRCIYFSI